jgi:hypothetical protein
VREEKPIDKNLIYKILSNRVYLGEIRHRDQWYPGEHPPIVERELWDAAQAFLARNPRVRANDTRASVAFLLKGLVEGSDGRALTLPDGEELKRCPWNPEPMPLQLTFARGHRWLAIWNRVRPDQ